MPIKRIVLAIAVIGLLSTDQVAFTSALNWDQIIGAKTSKLNDKQRVRVESLATSIPNTHGCKETIAKCVSQGDLTARRHAGFIVRMVLKNKKDKYIKEGVEKRHLSAHTDDIARFNLKEHPHRGKKDAKVTLVEYACFECPFCAHIAPTITKLQKKFGDQIVHYFKYYPVRSHKRSVPAAKAALAAHKQNKFFEMHDLLFANSPKLSDEQLREYAAKISLDMKKFDADMADSKTLKIIEKDKLEGMRNGVNGTPTFFFNGKQYQGSYDYDELTDRIEEELEIVAGKIAN